MTTLVIVAHPDDEVLSAGGMLAQTPGCHIVILTTGGTSRPGVLEFDHLREAAQEVGRQFNATVHHMGLPDQRLDKLDFLDLVQGVERVIGEIGPDVIYTHHLGDLNLDHQLVARAVLTACRPPNRATIYAGEVPSSTEWGPEPFRPNVFRKLTPVQQAAKERAMALYPTEVQRPPLPRNPGGLCVRSRYWGQVAGCEFAEPYVLLRGYL